MNLRWWKHRPSLRDPVTRIDGDRPEQLQHEFTLGRTQERVIVGLDVRVVRQASELLIGGMPELLAGLEPGRMHRLCHPSSAVKEAAAPGKFSKLLQNP